MVGGWWWLEHDSYFSIYWECHHPSWLSYFSEGLKPPTRLRCCLIMIRYSHFILSYYLYLYGTCIVSCNYIIIIHSLLDQTCPFLWRFRVILHFCRGDKIRQTMISGFARHLSEQIVFKMSPNSIEEEAGYKWHWSLQRH